MVELELEPFTHTYTLKGKLIPSVSEILDRVVPWDPTPFREWCVRQGIDPDEYRNEKARLGTKVHLAFAALGAGENVDPFDYPERAEGHIAGLKMFFRINGPEFLASERKTYSLEHNYAGTLDARVKFTLGKYKGRTALVDLKTGKRSQPDRHWPQLEAYEFAEVEQGQDPTDFRAVLKVTPAGRYRLTESTDTAADWLCLKAHYDSVIARAARKK